MQNQKAPTSADFDALFDFDEEDDFETVTAVKVDRLKEFYRKTKPPTIAEQRKKRQIWRGQPGSYPDPGIEADSLFIAQWQALYDECHDEETDYDF